MSQEDPWTCPKCHKLFPNSFGHGSHLKWCGRREELFWSLVRKTDSCWLYEGTLSFEGYSYVAIGSGVRRKQYQAHRFVWSLLKGEIPAGACVLHTCDVRNCVNPDHLYLGDRKDNARDKIRRRRDPNATLTYEQVAKIKARLAVEQKGLAAALAREYGVSQATICSIKKGKNYGYVVPEGAQSREVKEE